MSFDLSRALRRVRPGRKAAPAAGAPLAVDLAARRPDILLDTCVYIDVVQGRAPLALKTLLARRPARHSAVALAELTHLFGRLDPAHPGTRAVLDEIAGIIADIPERRLSAPSLQAFGEAGMLAGMLARMTGRPHGPAVLNDALLHLQAGEAGWLLVTRNTGDFGMLGRLAPRTAVWGY